MFNKYMFVVAWMSLTFGVLLVKGDDHTMRINKNSIEKEKIYTDKGVIRWIDKKKEKMMIQLNSGGEFQHGGMLYPFKMEDKKNLNGFKIDDEVELEYTRAYVDKLEESMGEPNNIIKSIKIYTSGGLFPIYERIKK